jgi:hypothetical protein
MLTAESIGETDSPRLMIRYIIASSVILMAGVIAFLLMSEPNQSPNSLRSTFSSAKLNSWVLNAQQYSEWLAKNPQHQSQGATSSSPSPSASPTEIPNGPNVSTLQTQVAQSKFVPATASVLESVDIQQQVGSPIARVRYAFGSGQTMAVTKQQLLQPLPLSAITDNSPADTVTDLPNGEVAIVVNRGAPQVAQAVVISSGGLLINVVTTTPPGNVLKGHPELSSGQLLTLAENLLGG